MLCENEFGVFVLSALLENANDQLKDQVLSQIQGIAGVLALKREGSKLIENCIKMIGRI